MELILDSYFRDIQIRKNVVARLEECETRLAEEAKERQGGEKEVRAKLESQSQTLQSYMDNTADVIRKLTEVGCSVFMVGGNPFTFALVCCQCSVALLLDNPSPTNPG